MKRLPIQSKTQAISGYCQTLFLTCFHPFEFTKSCVLKTDVSLTLFEIVRKKKKKKYKRSTINLKIKGATFSFLIKLWHVIYVMLPVMKIICNPFKSLTCLFYSFIEQRIQIKLYILVDELYCRYWLQVDKQSRLWYSCYAYQKHFFYSKQC